jgi:hypothetical protein
VSGILESYLRRGIGLRVALAMVAWVATAGVSGWLDSSAAEADAVWLCRPGIESNPCQVGLRTTVLVSPTGKAIGIRNLKPVAKPKVDCFYLYPTVSEQPTRNSNLRVGPEERSIALQQAARFSQYCRVFAPMYRQQTLAALGGKHPTDPADAEIAYESALEAWTKYLRTYNHGRGVVFIGHSQGSELLRRLIAEQVDPDPALRGRMLSALLLGGNVEVAKGRGIGGDFHHIPACRSNAQLGCVLAYSTFDEPVPRSALYGRVGGLFNPGDPTRFDVLCTNPAAPGGSSARLDSIYPVDGDEGPAVSGPPSPRVSTPWIEFRGAYRGRCSAADNAHVLQVKPLGAAPRLVPIPDPTWGLHLFDVNIALGNLVDLVRTEIAAYGEGVASPRWRSWSSRTRQG